ncbi:hypothetical protein B0A69_10300 [Chryseobacterium shigense]|uniref:Uncharacterized protein n=1 Tax=Chryseobacterium shigense TaxID=297244 RepID=A0A1N7HXQ6_9FLAO|nr:hypothetical protein [Chryseobacterium shigense]PQA94066.1 hypothetical protein B0A69_10300 [Chryseobacterium shigense]SIS29644.1 hypothetical protein SAMN05421639_101572 [Chryseobacterium shigense]
MELAVFQELTEEITLECFYMTESQQEEKVIQLIDLHHFVECYQSPVKILSYIHHPINIIEENGRKKGVLFFDLKHSKAFDWNIFEEFKRRNFLKELWFVFVEEDPISDTVRHTDFIIENSLEIFYDKIFLFNFFQSVIQPLK